MVEFNYFDYKTHEILSETVMEIVREGNIFMHPELTATCGINYLRIAKFINECPKCKSPFVGKTYGTLSIDGYFIKRECKCGFKFKYDMRKGKTTKDIQYAIKDALKENKEKRSVKK